MKSSPRNRFHNKRVWRFSAFEIVRRQWNRRIFQSLRSTTIPLRFVTKRAMRNCIFRSDSNRCEDIEWCWVCHWHKSRSGDIVSEKQMIRRGPLDGPKAVRIFDFLSESQGLCVPLGSFMLKWLFSRRKFIVWGKKTLNSDSFLLLDAASRLCVPLRLFAWPAFVPLFYTRE